MTTADAPGHCGSSSGEVRLFRRVVAARTAKFAADWGNPGIDPVSLFKIVFIQYLFGTGVCGKYGGAELTMGAEGFGSFAKRRMAFIWHTEPSPEAGRFLRGHTSTV